MCKLQISFKYLNFFSIFSVRGISYVVGATKRTFFIALEIVLWCKNWFMCHFYSPCFEYLEKMHFFLQVIQTQLFVSQGNIKSDKKVKIQDLQTLEGMLYESFTHHWPEESFTGASSSFCKMTLGIRPFLDGRFIIYFHPNDHPLFHNFYSCNSKGSDSKRESKKRVSHRDPSVEYSGLLTRLPLTH